MLITKLALIYLILNTAIWLIRHRELSQARKKSEILDSHYPLGKVHPLPKVTVLVAGKNEEKNIERCLRSLVAQDYPNLEVIAMNDRSTDNTGEIMDRVASESSGRLRVLHIQQLPDGWLGKPNAMHQGVQHASGEYLVFTDADCYFHCPLAVRIGVEFACEKNVDFLSVLPVLETKSFWERVIQPVCSAVLMIWYRPERVNNPLNPIAYANGAFMLFSRKGYNQLGGHPSVKEFLSEDMEFARLAKQKGAGLYVVQNRDLYRTRMYDDFGSTFAGWSRIFYGSFRKLSLTVMGLVMLFLMSVLPYLILISTVFKAAVKNWDLTDIGWWVMACSGLAIIAQTSVIMRFYQMMGQKWYNGLKYPLGAFITVGILFSSIKKFIGGKIVWRGSEIRHKNIRLHTVEKKD
jgi:chlorobactene glucosyltransferase